MISFGTNNGPRCACGGTAYSYGFPFRGGLAFQGNNTLATCQNPACTAHHPPFRMDPARVETTPADIALLLIEHAHRASREGRTFYRIRVGKRWLARGLVCEKGGARLTANEIDAGLYDGPVREGPDDYHGPAMTTGLARQILNYQPQVFVAPANGGPGFWSY